MVPSIHVHHIEQRPNSWTKSTQKSYEFSFLLFSHLYSFALRFIFLQTQPLTVSKVQLLYTAKEKGGNLIYIYTESSSLRTLKIRPRNLNEIVHS
jgi:hypothetical protein